MTGCPALLLFDLLVDVLKLGVAIRVGRPFQGLSIGLQTVSQFPQHVPDHPVADRMSHALEFVR